MNFFSKIIFYLLPTRWLNFLDKYKIHCLKKISLYDFLRLYVKELSRAEISRRAMSISYSLFMSFFPFVVFFFSLIVYLPYNEEIGDYLHNCIYQILPDQTEQTIWNIITELIPSKKPTILSWSFILLLFLSTNGVYSFLESFKKIDSFEKTSFLKNYLKAFLLTIFLTLLLLLVIILIYYSQVVYRFFIETNISRKILNVSSYLIIWIAFFISINILYVFGGKIEKSSWKKKLPGTFFTTVLFIISSFLFGIYIRNFSKINLLYGSMRTALIIMFWLYINNVLILAGYKLNFTIDLIKKSKY